MFRWLTELLEIMRPRPTTEPIKVDRYQRPPPRTDRNFDVAAANSGVTNFEAF